MASNLFNQLSQTRQPQNNLLQMMNSIRQSSNPKQTLMNLASQDSRVSSILQEVQASGGDAKALFYKKARQMGINPNSILSQFR